MKLAAYAALIVALIFMPTGEIKAEAAGEKVYLGGYPVNIELYTEGPVVLTSCNDDVAAVGAFKEGVSGLGTVTFEKSDGSYRALGHAVTDDSGTDLSAAYGYVYDSSVIGVKLPSDGTAGRLIGKRAGNDPIGNILINDMFGLSGDMFISPRGEECEVLSHDKVRPGKAVMCTTVGAEREMYDIEIVKASVGRGKSEKSMVIRVTDPDLLEKTGGILQGMSGSPILQDGKLAGAVTHVFTEDPTRGYGVYAEWML